MIEDDIFIRNRLREYRDNPDPEGKPWGPDLYKPLKDGSHPFKDDEEYMQVADRLSRLRRNPAKPQRSKKDSLLQRRLAMTRKMQNYVRDYRDREFGDKNSEEESLKNLKRQGEKMRFKRNPLAHADRLWLQDINRDIRELRRDVRRKRAPRKSLVRARRERDDIRHKLKTGRRPYRGIAVRRNPDLYNLHDPRPRPISKRRLTKKRARFTDWYRGVLERDRYSRPYSSRKSHWEDSRRSLSRSLKRRPRRKFSRSRRNPAECPGGIYTNIYGSLFE